MNKILFFIYLLLFSGQSFAATIADGDDWSMPAWVTPWSDYGYFSEESNTNFNINTHVIDVTWRQINPSQGVYSDTSTDTWTEVASGGSTFVFDSFTNQRNLTGHYWLRIWMSGEQWAPAWVLTDCNIPLNHRWIDHSEQDRHIPLWNTCVWNHAKIMYKHVFDVWGVKNDPKFEMAYVPGGFFYSEFDFDVMQAAVNSSAVTEAELLTWLADIRTSLTTILGNQKHKLMYTGQDYPFDLQNTNDSGGAFELHAAQAVQAGMGIRNGISELFNFHLNETPAYGSHIQSDGHVTIDETNKVHTDNHVIGNENECYNACGFTTADPYYAVVMSNLKALQLRTNKLYVVPSDSYMTQYSDHWAWVEKELGWKADNAPDAWVSLREYEDKYFAENTPTNNINWNGKPWLHNFERWLVQKDIVPDGMSRRGTDVRVNVLDSDNGTSYEGRLTDRANAQDYLYFFVQDNFAFGDTPSMQIKVTYKDIGTANWQLQYRNNAGNQVVDTVTNTNTGTLKTATFNLMDPSFENGMSGNADFKIYNGGTNDIEVTFVRLIRLLKLFGETVFINGFE